MNSTRGESAFTLVELLIVVAIIVALVAILAPGLGVARELARRAYCVAHLNGLGRAMGMYHANNKDSFWPGAIPNYPEPGVITYFWGTNTNPVDTRPSPFMKYCDSESNQFLCPSLQWGSYEPQGKADRPTTTVGYNTWCLDPASYKWDWRLKPKRAIELPNPASLFVFADSAMAWSPSGRLLFQNSTHLEPVSGPPRMQPTTHFRHLRKTNALSADGHAAYYGLEGGVMRDPAHKLGFVGANNVPHYDITNE